MAGFIGYHVAQKLLARGHEVSGVDNLNPYYSVDLKRARLEQLGDRVKFWEMDICEAERLAALMRAEEPAAVLHLAAQAGVRHSIDHPFEYSRANLTGHLSVIEAVRHMASKPHLVYASSSSVYGSTSVVPFREDDAADKPVSLYGATKRANELMSHSYAHLFGIPQIGLRFFTVYGSWGRPDMAYWMFTEAILSGKPIRVFNSGEMARDMTHISDVVDGIVATLERPPTFEESETPHRIYNVGNSRPERLNDMISTLEALTTRKAVRQFEPMQLGDVVRTYADISKFRAHYG
jgi:UDP-glucuronate 4-epimerase